MCLDIDNLFSLSWVSIGVSLVFFDFHGFSLVFMGFHGFSLVFFGIGHIIGFPPSSQGLPQPLLHCIMVITWVTTVNLG